LEKISIIIPVYNVEPYLRRCLDSVINQTHKNLEILCIDDGSTDNSGSICEEYAKKDSRIRVLHKENGGVSSARNVGLTHFTGYYLGFVDSDDWIEPDMYETLYASKLGNNVSLCAVSFTRDDIIESPRELIPQRELTRYEMLLYAIRNVHYAGFGRVIWNKLYSSTDIRDIKLRFDENLKIAEDLKFIANLLFSGERSGVFINTPLYHYSRRPSSLMDSLDYEHSLDELKSYKEIINSGDEIGLSDVTVWLKRQHCYNASLLLEKAIKHNDIMLLEVLRNEMSLYAKEYIMTNSEYPERLKRLEILM